MTIPFPVKWISLSLVLLLSAKLSNQSWKFASPATPTARSSVEQEALVTARYGILVVRSQNQETEPQSELEDYFIVHFNQENIARLKHDLTFYPLIDLPDTHDICYQSGQESNQFLKAVVVVKYETVLRCNISSQARDAEQRGARGLLIQLPRHVRVSDVQVGQHSTIDPFFFIALISEKTTESIFRNDHSRRQQHYLNYSNKNWTNDSNISVSVFAPQTLDSTALIPFDLKTLAVWITAVITLILGSYFSGRRNYVNVKKKFPFRVDQMDKRSKRQNSSSSSSRRRANSSASDENSIHSNSQANDAEADEAKGEEEKEERDAPDEQEDEDGEHRLLHQQESAASDQNKSVLHVIFLVCWLAVLPFVLFIFFNFIAYFMVAVFAAASVVILYVCCDSPSEHQKKSSVVDKSTGSVRRGHHHQHDGKDGENDAEQIASASTSSSNSASTITSLSVAKKLLLDHRPQQQYQRSGRGSLVRANAVTSESPASSVTGIRRGRLRRSNTSGSSETGSIEEDSLYYYHRSHDSSIPALQHPLHHRYNLHPHEPAIAKYNDRRQMLPSRSCESAMSSCPSTMLSSSAHAVLDADGAAIVIRRPLHRSSSILKQSHYQNSSFETSEGQSDTTTSRSLSRQTTFSNRDQDQEISGISVARPFLKSGFLEAAFTYDEENHKLVISVMQVSEICINTRSSPAHVVVHLALLPHKKQKYKTRVRLCSDESCVKLGESFCFLRIDPEDIASLGCRFRLYSCELLRRQSLIGETVLSFASCKPLASETKIMLTLEQKSRFSVSVSLLILLFFPAPLFPRPYCSACDLFKNSL